MTSRRTKQNNLRNEAKTILQELYPRAKNIQLMKSGKYSGVYSFEESKNKLIFKMPVDWFPLESEYFFLTEAKNTGLVPRVHQVNLKENWIVIGFIEGESSWENFGKEKYLKLWRDFGRKAKKIHSIETTGVGLYASGKFKNNSNLEFLDQELDWVLKNDLFNKKVGLDKRHADTLKKASALIPERFSLLHGDLALNNTIRDRNKVSAFIDPGPWRGGHPFFDLGHVHSQALSYKEIALKILEAFSEGYDEKLDWNSIQLQFCSLFWDLIVLRFFAEKDIREFENRLIKQTESIKNRLKFLNNALPK